jgi:hypothetical protein
MEQKSSVVPQKWWQWILVYPALVISLIGAVPNWMDHWEAIKIGVPADKLDIANHQHDMFARNLDCMRELDFKTIGTQSNMEVGAKICPSGDILVSIKLGNSDPQLR